MPRPTKPLINRGATVRASLEIIDSEGLEALSLPRLAKHLGVQAPSLYHHFSDKSEILTAVVRHIAGASVSRPRRKPGPDWPEYFVALGLSFRQAILRHRNAAPLLVQYLPRDLLIESYEAAAKFLLDSGVPSHLHVQILDGMETISIGAVLREATHKANSRAKIFPNVDPEAQPLLAEALAVNELTAKELFADSIRSFLHGVVRDKSSERLALDRAR